MKEESPWIDSEEDPKEVGDYLCHWGSPHGEWYDVSTWCEQTVYEDRWSKEYNCQVSVRVKNGPLGWNEIDGERWVLRWMKIPK